MNNTQGSLPLAGPSQKISQSVVFSLNDRLPEASGFILRGFRWACQMPGRGSKLLPSGLRDIV